MIHQRMGEDRLRTLTTSHPFLSSCQLRPLVLCLMLTAELLRQTRFRETCQMFFLWSVLLNLDGPASFPCIFRCCSWNSSNVVFFSAVGQRGTTVSAAAISNFKSLLISHLRVFVQLCRLLAVNRDSASQICRYFTQKRLLENGMIVNWKHEWHTVTELMNKFSWNNENVVCCLLCMFWFFWGGGFCT